MADQKNYLDTTLKAIILNNKMEMEAMEKQCLDRKHALIRGIATVAHKAAAHNELTQCQR